MWGRGRTVEVKENLVDAGELAVQLAADKKFRERLLAALQHGLVARERARQRLGLIAAVSRLASDEGLRRELGEMTRELRAASRRLEQKRTRRLRNSLLLLAGGGAAAAVAVAPVRRWLGPRLGRLGLPTSVRPRVIQAEVEVEAPVSTAYNQWTQFEQFPQFMEGVEEVKQLDDTRLHWVATVAGRRAEWDAKILEQHPDQQVSWISEDGKKTRGTVSFESRGSERTLVRLSMSYQAEGIREALGSAAGLDSRRVNGDLQRFKELIESRNSETGAWRGDISAGTTT